MAGACTTPGDRPVAEAYPLFRLANRLYRRCPSLYLALYGPYKRFSDRAELRVMRASIRPGMRCVDVGANVGVTTAWLARLAGPAGRIHAFEPSPDNFAFLTRRRWPPHVELVQAAVGAAPGEVALHVSGDLNIDHRTYPTEDARAQLRVPQVRLDDAVAAPSIDFLKLDVQGYEVEVLKGAERLLRDSPGLVAVVEFWPFGLRLAGASAEELLRRLRDAGLTVSWLDGGPVERWEDRADWYRNVVARRG
jgi:FkbM family methyltransferase